jgi:hypothetical protein
MLATLQSEFILFLPLFLLVKRIIICCTPEAGSWPDMHWKPVFILHWPDFHAANVYYPTPEGTWLTGHAMETGFILHWPDFYVASRCNPTLEAGSWPDMHLKPVLSCTNLTFMEPSDIIRLLRQVVDRPCNKNRFYPALTWLSCSQRILSDSEAGSWPDMQWKPVLSCTDLTFM